MTSKQFILSPRSALLAVSLFIVAVRLCTLTFPDLVDTTEGRYAGVAQLMLQRGDWVTPWIHYEGVDQPYLGKPPLHFWLIQTSFLIFGENNFAARFPGVVSAIGIGAALAIGTLGLLGWEAAIVTAVVFASSCMSFFLSGAVLLDVTLTLGVTITLLGFLRAEHSRLAGYLVFIGLALGVMTKGPLAGILAGCVIVPWIVGSRILTRQWPKQLMKLPWVAGIVLFLALVSPWYIWAEIRNPGFLEYFLWTENIGRYLHSDYVDEYGSGHRQPFGAAIVMTLLGVFPWSFLLLGLVVPHFRRMFSPHMLTVLGRDSNLLFALCWTLSCPVLLLGAEQYTATYLMPTVPGFAFLMGVLWYNYRDGTIISPVVVKKALTFAIIGILAVWIGVSVASLWFAPNIPVVVSALALAIWVAVAYRRMAQSSGSAGYGLQQIGFLSLAATLAYGVVVVSFNNTISTNRSSRRVLQKAHAIHGSSSPVTVAFPYYFPFSASFYAPSIFGSESKLIEVRDGQVDTTTAELLIVRKRNVSKLLKERPNATEIDSVGQWRIFKP